MKTMVLALDLVKILYENIETNLLGWLIQKPNFTLYLTGRFFSEILLN